MERPNGVQTKWRQAKERDFRRCQQHSHFQEDCATDCRTEDGGVA